jgi:hypothetical protein
MKTIKEMFGDLPMGMGHISKRKSVKINNQNGDGSDEADFIDKQISPEPPMDKTGNATANDQAATGNIQPNTLKGKNPASPDGVYESGANRYAAQYDKFGNIEDITHGASKSQVMKLIKKTMVKGKLPADHTVGYGKGRVEDGPDEKGEKDITHKFKKEDVNEGLKLLATHDSPNGHKAKVYKDAEWGEHRVKFYGPDGKHKGENSDYHTDDKEDAHDTAKAQLQRYNEEVISDELLDRIYEGEEYTSKFIETLNEVDKINNLVYTDKEHKSMAKNYARQSDEHRGLVDIHRSIEAQHPKFTTFNHLHGKLAAKHDELSTEYANLSSLHQEVLGEMLRNDKLNNKDKK